MEAQELRIGNWIQFRHTETPVRITLGDFVREYNDEHLEDYEPIPLTEEWLTRFGFEQHHDDCSNGVMYIKDIFSEQPKTWGVYPNEVGSGIVIKDSIKLEHVHQLQNLYFALTGEELNQNKEDDT